MFRACLILLSIVLVTSCGMIPTQGPDNSGPDRPDKAATPPPTTTRTATPDSTPEETAGMTATLGCQTLETGDYVVYKKQTFAIDFEPFRNSCFVTTHNPEFDDPPMESQIAIYKNGRKVFDFPYQFNGVNYGCWVDGVSFKDLNGDKRNDVIVVAKCQAKSGPYNENSVYVNNGKGFTTREDANTQLGEFKSIKEVTDYVGENASMFF